MYTKTVAREALMGAFVSWNKFEDFISSITNSLYSGNYIDEFKYTKGLIQGAYENNKAIVEVVDAITDQASAKAFIKKCRNLYAQMSFPSSNFNAYSKNTGDNKPVVTWTDASRVVLLLRADILAEVDVEVLANAFQMDKTTFLGRVLPVDNFGNDKILGLIADEAFFQIYENQFRFDEFYNARVMAWNYYLHVWQTFAICPFANAVILATEAPAVGYSSMEFTEDSVAIEQGESGSASVAVAPITGNADITYSVTAVPDTGSASHLTLTKSADQRTVGIAVNASAVVGNYTVQASTGSGGDAITDTITVTVSA